MAALTWLAMFVHGWATVPPDTVVLHYTGGPIQGERFEEVVPPGTRMRFYGLLEHLYELPATQRNYIMSKHPDPEGGWDNMVADTFRQQIVAAIQDQARQHVSEDIYANGANAGRTEPGRCESWEFSSHPPAKPCRRRSPTASNPDAR